MTTVRPCDWGDPGKDAEHLAALKSVWPPVAEIPNADSDDDVRAAS